MDFRLWETGNRENPPQSVTLSISAAEEVKTERRDDLAIVLSLETWVKQFLFTALAAYGDLLLEEGMPPTEAGGHIEKSSLKKQHPKACTLAKVAVFRSTPSGTPASRDGRRTWTRTPWATSPGTASSPPRGATSTRRCRRSRKTAHVIADLEASAVVYLAGNAAERRALQGSAPGWRRWRTPEELRALHEAGHAIAQWARGDRMWKLSIIVDENVRIGKSGFLGGYSSAGITPEPPGPIELPARMDCDLRRAARTCQMLSLWEPPYGWRGAVRVGQRLRGRTRDLVDRHWYLIEVLAGDLVRHKELNQAQIEPILAFGALRSPR